MRNTNRSCRVALGRGLNILRDVVVFAVKKFKGPKHGLALTIRTGPPLPLGSKCRPRNDAKRIAEGLFDHLCVDRAVREVVATFWARQHPPGHSAALLLVTGVVMLAALKGWRATSIFCYLVRSTRIPDSQLIRRRAGIVAEYACDTLRIPSAPQPARRKGSPRWYLGRKNPLGRLTAPAIAFRYEPAGFACKPGPGKVR
jgi:hypothetical protein